MKQRIEDWLTTALQTLEASGKIPASLKADFAIEHAKTTLHGDFSSSIALKMSKLCGLPPRELATQLMESLPTDPLLIKTEIAGPGFINFFLASDAKHHVIADVLKNPETFGHTDIGQNKRVLIEFVSANPTGPLHVGHGRSAAFGASLANLLSAAGFDVSCEYYVNDAGRQMNILAVSVWLRYLSVAGQTITFPANAYRGDYVTTLAETLFAEYQQQFVRDWPQIAEGLPLDEPFGGDKERYIDALINRAKALLGEPGFRTFHQAALTWVLADIKSDLAEFDVTFEQWFSEQSLMDEGAIEKGIQALKANGHTFEQEGALWFRSTAYGDEKDRVLVRANGQTTYFASDVAYHWNKYERGFDRVIDIFGADHHGYISRVRAAVRALGHDDDALDVLLVQFAILYRDGERVQMSTRSGSFVTLRELREEVGCDAARFFYVMRKPEQHMDFDLTIAKSQSNDNPAYYIQYAHARIASVMNQMAVRGYEFDEQVGLNALSHLTTPEEIILINTLARYPEIIKTSAQACEPHQVAYYLRDLAQALHSYYNATPILCEDTTLRQARLVLLTAVRHVLRGGLSMLGVQAPVSM